MDKTTSLSKRFSIIEVGTFEKEGDYARFKFKVPSYAKKLTGVFPFSEVLCNQLAEYTEINLSLSINNGETVVVSEPFTLGVYSRTIKPLQRMKSLDEELKPGQYITGYVECINAHFNAAFDVKVYLAYERVE
jgi:hypothetical protein